MAQNDDATKDSSAKPLRLIGYSAALLRAFPRVFPRFLPRVLPKLKYAAFSSDVGHALQPAVNVPERTVDLALLISVIYCVGDVYHFAVKSAEAERKEGKSSIQLGRLVAERTTYQILSTFLAPYAAVHCGVVFGEALFKKLGRYQRWGPSTCGLLFLSVVPLFLDEVIEEEVNKFYSTLD